MVDKRTEREWEMALGDWQEYFLHAKTTKEGGRKMATKTVASIAFS